MRMLAVAALLISLAQTQRYEPVAVTPMFAEDIPPAVQNLRFESYPRALQNLDFRPLSESGIGGAPLALGQAVQHIAAGRVDAALELLEAIRDAPQRGIASIATQLRVNLLFNRGDYDAVTMVVAASGSEADTSVQQLRRLPRERFEALEEPVASRLQMTPTNVPLIDVLANSARHGFVFDTGAAFTVVTEKLARELNVQISAGDRVDVDTSTDTIRARYGVLAELAFGAVRIHDHTVLVVDDDALRFELVDGSEFAIEGIVGWNAIRRVRAELDYPGGEYNAELSEPRDYDVRNLFWLGYPLVRLRAGDGQALLFGLDTGARNTSITGNIFAKVHFGSVTKRPETIGGAGGARRVETEVVDRLTLMLTAHRLVLTLVRREDTSDPVFVLADGTLGSDVARRCRIVIDYPNAHFGLSLVG